MDRSSDLGDAAQEALAREMRLVDSAVAMVAGGHAPRMQLGGLACGDALLDYARRAASAAGVRVTPLWGIGEEGLGFTFERPAVAPGAAPDAGPAANFDQGAASHEHRHA